MSASMFCRLCALKTDNCINVFDPEGDGLNLPEKVKLCLQIQLSPDDPLPRTVCLECIRRVEEYFSYFQSCSLAQDSLLEAFCFASKKPSTSDALPQPQMAQSSVQPIPNESDANLLDIIEEEEGINLNEKETNCEMFSSLTESLQQPERLENPEGANLLPNSTNLDNIPEEEEDIFNETVPPTQSVFEGYVWGCTLCSENFLSLQHIKCHYLVTHKEQPVFKCMTCSKVYERYRSFARHVKLHQQIRPFSCNICGKRFSQKTILQSHKTVHSEERPHVCSQCGKAFKQFSSLYLHNKCHLPEQTKPKFACVICSKEFSTKYSINTHMKIHTGERNFICDVCGKSFISKGSLDYHLMSHNETKPHTCLICSKRTARLLSKHSTLHSGVKPYQCDVCGKQFRERSGLKEHTRIHTGAMPYSCEFCGRSFRFKGILTIHKRQHTGERPYSCSDCVRVFTNWPNYNKHMKRRHKVSEGQRSDSVTVTPELQAPPETPVSNVQDANEIFKTLTETDTFRVFNSPISSIPLYDICTGTYRKLMN